MKKKERKPCGEEARGLSKFALIPNMPLQRITSSYVAMLECSAKCTTQRERERVSEWREQSPQASHGGLLGRHFDGEGAAVPRHIPEGQFFRLTQRSALSSQKRSSSSKHVRYDSRKQTNATRQIINQHKLLR